MVTQSTLNKAVYFYNPLRKKALPEMEEAVELQNTNIQVNLPKNSKLILKDNLLGCDEAVIASRSGNKSKAFKRRPAKIGLTSKNQQMMLTREVSIPLSNKKVVVIPMQEWYGLIHQALDSDLASLAESSMSAIGSVKDNLFQWKKAISARSGNLKNLLSSETEKPHHGKRPEQTPQKVEAQSKKVWQAIHNPSFIA